MSKDIMITTMGWKFHFNPDELNIVELMMCFYEQYAFVLEGEK